MEHRYYPVKAIRYHFTEFNIIVGIFVAINGGLLVAYSGDGLKEDDFAKILITILGYIASGLFFCCSGIYNLCIINLSILLKKHFEKKTEDYLDYTYPLRYAKVSTTYIVLIFSAILMLVWGILFACNIINCKEINVSWSCYVIISIISLIPAIIVFISIKCCFIKCVEKKQKTYQKI